MFRKSLEISAVIWFLSELLFFVDPVFDKVRTYAFKTDVSFHKYGKNSNKKRT